MLSRNAYMGSKDRALEMAPEALQAIRVVDAVYPLLGGVRDDTVLVASVCEVPVGRPFVAADRRAGADFLDDDALKCSAPRVWHNAGHYIAIPLQHTEDDRLASSPATTLARVLAANISLINFDVSRQIVVAINFAHVLADFVTDAPRGLVGHAKLALQFLRRDAVSGRGEQVHGVEPLLQRRPGILKRRSGHRVNVVAAPRAGIGGKLRQPHETTFLAALRAFKCLAMARLHQMREAAIVIREALEKVLYGEVLSHRPLHLRRI